jgi:hypothetical protein
VECQPVLVLEFLDLSLKQTAADSNFGPWFDLFPSKSNPWSKNIICREPTELQLSFKSQGLYQLGLQDTKLQSGIPKTKLHYDLAKFSEIQNSTLLNLGSSI